MSGSSFFSLPTLLAAAIFSLVAAVPLQAPPQGKDAGGHALEVSMASSRAGFVQLFYGDDSGGMGEATSSRMPVETSTTSRRYRLALPVGKHRELRLDPLDRPGSVTIESIRVVTSSGRSVRAIALSELKPQHQIQSTNLRGDRLEIQTTADGDDPQLALTLDPPLEIRLSWWQRFPAYWRWAGGIFTALVVTLIGLERLPRLRRGLARGAVALAARPVKALAIIAAGAVILSAYPVVFFGKSFVSPNYVPLLYAHMPTLPEATSLMIATGRGSDVGAMMWQHLPYSVIQQRALAQGELPLWNRYNSLGAPLLGQGQSMAGDPLHLGVVLAGGAAWAWDAKFLVAKWLFAFGLGLIVLRVTQHLGAALLVAFATPFIGFFLVRINHPSYFSLCYAPWPLYAWLRLAAADTRRTLAWSAAGLLVANFVLMNSGTVKEAYLLLFTMNFSGLCVVLGNGSDGRSRWLKLAVGAWTAVLLVLLTAPVWSTFLHTLRNAQTNYEAAAAYQIPPALLLGAFDEAFFRLIMPEEYVSNASINFLLLLGLLYFLSTWSEQRGNRIARALAFSTLLPFALVFGVVPASWLTAVPLLGRVLHIDHCFLAALIVLWSVLAGVGFATAAKRLATPNGRSDLLRVAFWLVALVGAWIAFRQVVHRGTFTMLQHGQVLPVSGFVWGYLATLLAATVVFVFTVRSCFVRRTLPPAAGIVLLLCGVALLWRHALHGEVVGFERHVVRPAPRANLHAHSGAMDYVRAAQDREPGRGFGVRHNLMPGWSVIYGIEGINGPDALMNPWYRELLSRCGAPPSGGWELVLLPEQVPDVRRFFDAINVRYYFAPRGDAALLRRMLEPAGSFDLDVWESPSAWPRAFFTDRVGTYDHADDLVATIKSGDGRPFAALPRADRDLLPKVGQELAGRQVVPARGYRLTENTTSFEIQASGPGLVVVSEPFWPGDFRVEVNGAKGRVLRINHAFKGVAVEAAGDYRITFRYVPRHFPRNLILCGTGAFLGLLSLGLALTRSPFATEQQRQQELNPSEKLRVSL